MSEEKPAAGCSLLEFDVELMAASRLLGAQDARVTPIEAGVYVHIGPRCSPACPHAASWSER